MAGISNPAIEHDAKTRGIILHIVEQIKREGVFDRFRRDCLEELDSKEPYRQLKQRVESHVATFLSKQMFSANLPKNQLRTSLRANINQSEVLSKGVDRLLEQVLVEKSSSFYKEIENLVEEHLISTGHYTRYDRDKPQRSDGQPRSELTKLSDKEVEDIIKQETDRLLEASADERSQESDRSSIVDTPPPGTSGEVIEVETLINATDDIVETFQVLTTNVEANIKPTTELSSESSAEKPSVEMSESEAPVLKDKTEQNQQVDASNVSDAQNSNETQTDASKGQEIVAQISEPENSTSASVNANEISQISKPDTIPESNSASSSATLDASLQDESQAMDIDAAPTLSESQGSIDVNKPKIERSEECKQAIEITQDVGATIVQATTLATSTEQQDIPEGSIPEEAVNPGSKLEDSKADIKKINVKMETTEDPTVEIKKAEIPQPKIDNPEMSKLKTDETRKIKPEVGKPEVHKPEVVKQEVVGQEVVKSKVIKPEVATAQLSKPKVDKTQEMKEKTKAKQTTTNEQKPASKTPISMPNLFSTDEETDEDLGIQIAKIPGIILGSKPGKSKPEISELDIAELSDSDITVSSVHTSDLSSLEDSDMEYEDYQELALKKSQEKRSDESGASTIKIDGEFGAAASDNMDKSDEKKSGEFDTVTSKNIDGESSAETMEKIDSNEKKSGESCRSKNIDGMESGHGADTSQKFDNKEDNEENKSDESSLTTSQTIDTKEKISEKTDVSSIKIDGELGALTSEKFVGESGAVTSEGIDGESGAVTTEEIVGESDAVTSEGIDGESGAVTSEEIDGESDAVTSEEIDGESGAVTSEEIDDKEKSEEMKSGESSATTTTKINTKDRNSDAATDKENDESNVEKADTTTLHDSKTEVTESPSPANTEDEGQTCDRTEQPSNSQLPASDAALFKPIEPAAPQGPEPASSQDSEPAFAPATSDDTTDADNETMEDSDIGNIKLSKRRHSRRISTGQESESSNDTPIPTEAQPQRRSARVASKDKPRPDEKDDHSQGYIQKSEEASDSSRKLRRTRYSQEKTHEVTAPRSTEERRNERAEKRASRLTSDSTDPDIKPSKRSKRTVRPTRCYSPSENS